MDTMSCESEKSTLAGSQQLVKTGKSYSRQQIGVVSQCIKPTSQPWTSFPATGGTISSSSEMN